jgi:hypothetical protein
MTGYASEAEPGIFCYALHRRDALWKAGAVTVGAALAALGVVTDFCALRSDQIKQRDAANHCAENAGRFPV